MGEPWPTTPEFRAFAAKIADACTQVMAQGYVIKPARDEDSRRECCPVGAVNVADGFATPGLRYPFPDTGGLGSFTQRYGFMRGFDGFSVRRPDPYYRLGAAYRKRFGNG
jgi:hypothetical protein